MRISAKEIEIATEGRLEFGECSLTALSVATDTRADCRKSLFVPLSGPNFDGHGFISQAFEKGASIALADRDVSVDRRFSDRALIRVENTLEALGKLAAWHRLRFNPLVVGVTGSVGKTTAKEMISLVLGKKYEVHKTLGNFNNEIGLPLSIFGLTEKHTALVLEMGMNRPGEIMKLSKIARPDIVVITNIGLAHLGQLGTKQNILKAKLEIMEGLSKNGTMFLNGDDMLLHGLMGLIDRPIVYYGIDENLDVVGSDIKLKGDQGFEFEFQWQQRGYKAVVRIAGAHNVYNALAAVAVGLQSEVRPEQIVEALGEYRPDRMRMNITNAGDVKLINDAYNANPQSVQAAIDVLAGLDAKSRRIAALGDMLELGETSGQYHRQMGAYAASKNIDLIVSVGRYARDVAEGAIEAGAAWAAGVPGAGGGAPDSANAVIGSGAGTGAGTGIAAAEISAGGSGAEEKSAATGAGAGAGASNAGAVSTCAAKCAAFGDKREAGEYLLRTITAGDVVLIKGSRATAMESIADSISESAARLGTGAGAMPAAPLPTHSGGLEIYD